MRLTLCEAPTPETRPDHNTGNYVQDTITIRALRLTCNTQYLTRFNTLLIEENQKLKQNQSLTFSASFTLYLHKLNIRFVV